MVGLGGWEVRGGLNLPLGLFGLAMDPTSASHRLKQLEWRNRCLPITGVNFRLMPSM